MHSHTQAKGVVSVRRGQQSQSDGIRCGKYEVHLTAINGRRVKIMTLPNGDKLEIEPDDKLVVVNGRPLYLVKTASDMLAAIRRYNSRFTCMKIRIADETPPEQPDIHRTLDDWHVVCLRITPLEETEPIEDKHEPIAVVRDDP